MALIAEKTCMKVRVFVDLKTDPLTLEEKWRIPLSSPEVKTFNGQKSPRIIIFDKQEKRGTNIEHPKLENTLEEGILHTIKQQ